MGFRRSEGGWADVAWAFMVARGQGHGRVSMSEHIRANHDGRP